MKDIIHSNYIKNIICLDLMTVFLTHSKIYKKYQGEVK